MPEPAPRWICDELSVRSTDAGRVVMSTVINRQTGWTLRLIHPDNKRSVISLMHAVSDLDRGAFRGGRRGNSVHILETLPERIGAAFPLLKCLRTHYGRHCEPFSGQKNALDCSIFHIQSQNHSGGNIPGLPQKRPRCLDQTPIFAWFASVPIVPVLRNDQ